MSVFSINRAEWEKTSNGHQYQLTNVPVMDMLNYISLFMRHLGRANGHENVCLSPCGGFGLETQMNVLVHNTYIASAIPHDATNQFWRIRLNTNVWEAIVGTPIKPLDRPFVPVDQRLIIKKIDH